MATASPFTTDDIHGGKFCTFVLAPAIKVEVGRLPVCESILLMLRNEGYVHSSNAHREVRAYNTRELLL
jgi:hypothetical protein